MTVTNKQIEIIEDLPLDGDDKWYVLLAVMNLKKASWLSVRSAVWRQGDAPNRISQDRIKLMMSKLDELVLYYEIKFRNTDAGIWQPNEGTERRTRYNQIADIFIGVSRSAADELAAAQGAMDHKAIGLALDYPRTAVEAFDTHEALLPSRASAEEFPHYVLENTHFISPPENPGLLSPGMNGTSIAERTLASA